MGMVFFSVPLPLFLSAQHSGTQCAWGSIELLGKVGVMREGRDRCGHRRLQISES